jgi:hypothetical protein
MKKIERKIKSSLVLKTYFENWNPWIFKKSNIHSTLVISRGNEMTRGRAILLSTRPWNWNLIVFSRGLSDEAPPNFIERKHAKIRKQRARIEVQASKQPNKGRPQGGKRTTKNQTLHHSHEANQWKKGGDKPDKTPSLEEPMPKSFKPMPKEDIWQSFELKANKTKGCVTRGPCHLH